MANRSYLSADDPDLESLGLDDMAPYSSISSRQPLEELEDLQLDQESALPDPVASSAPAPASSRIKEYMLSKQAQAPAPMAAKTPDYSSDPLMKGFDAQQTDLDNTRAFQRESNLISNLGLAASQASRGASAPVANTDLYKNMEHQNESMLASKGKDLDRRQRIINAIESRKTREAATKESQAARADQRSQAEDFKRDRMLSGLASRFQQDPIIKPSEINLATLDKAKSLIENTQLPLTSQSLADVEQDIAASLSLRPNVLSEGKIKRTEIEDLNRSIGQLKQKYGNSMVDMRKEAPEIVTQLTKMRDILADDYVDTLNKRTEKLVNDQKSLLRDPQSQKALDTYLSQSRREKSQRMGMTPENEATPVRVKDPTGRVRLIPKNQLKAAIAAGGSEVP